MQNDKKAFTALIAARMGSSRFPGKTLSDLYGKPMLERIVERIKFSRYVQDIIIATSAHKSDNKIKGWCEANNLKCFQGDENDVLLRLYETAKYFSCSTIVEILGDNPLVHSSLIDSAIELFKSENYDYVATVTNEYPAADPNLKKFPVGVRVQVISFNALQKCAELAKQSRYREHATSYIAEHPDIFRTGFVEADQIFKDCNRPELTFAVNYKQNLELINNIYTVLYDKDNNFSVSVAIRIFEKHPKWKILMGNES